MLFVYIPILLQGRTAQMAYLRGAPLWYKMKRMLTRAIVLTMLVIASSVVSCPSAFAQKPAAKAQTEAKASTETNAPTAAKAPADTAAAPATDTQDADTADDASLAALGSDDSGMPAEESQGFYKSLKVALALVLGLAFCIERIIYLSLSEINAKKFMADLCKKIEAGDIEGGKAQCRDTRGPVASICYQGLERIGEKMDNIERSIISYGSVQSANLEKGCSWITLFIAMAPSLGFLGTVVGMVMAFDQIQTAGDISPTIVAAGMKVALITTIFGIIVALILQLFYNYILSKIDHLTSQMEESAITLMDSITKYKKENLTHEDR